MADSDDDEMGDFTAPVFQFVPKGAAKPQDPGAFPSSEIHFDPSGSADDGGPIHFDPSRVNPYESAKLSRIPLKSSKPRRVELRLNTATAILLGVGLFLAFQMATGGFPFGHASNPYDDDDED